MLESTIKPHEAYEDFMTLIRGRDEEAPSPGTHFLSKLDAKYGPSAVFNFLERNASAPAIPDLLGYEKVLIREITSPSERPLKARRKEALQKALPTRREAIITGFAAAGAVASYADSTHRPSVDTERECQRLSKEYRHLVGRYLEGSAESFDKQVDDYNRRLQKHEADVGRQKAIAFVEKGIAGVLGLIAGAGVTKNACDIMHELSLVNEGNQIARDLDGIINNAVYHGLVPNKTESLPRR